MHQPITSHTLLLCLVHKQSIENTNIRSSDHNSRSELLTMATSAIQNPLPVTGESKSARKKKAKAEAAANGTSQAPAVPDATSKDNSSLDGKVDPDNSTEHPYIKELAKHIRNINKKLSGMQKVDSIITENPDSSLDQLVAERKINADQKAAALKKPQLQEQLKQLEEQIQQYRKLDSEHQSQLQKQKDELTAQHQKELEKATEDLRMDGVSNGAAELRKKLLTFSQFLRCAAAKRTKEEEADTEESRAFEGALLLVYGGDQLAVDTAMSIIEGTDEKVPSIEGAALPVKCKSFFLDTCGPNTRPWRFLTCHVPYYLIKTKAKQIVFTDSQIKQSSIDHAPFQTEETWVDQVAQANASEVPAEIAPSGSDPTIAHAGLTELDTSAQTNGIAQPVQESITSPPQGDAGDAAGNAAGDRWDPANAGAEKTGLEDSFEMLPRPQDELETPATVEQQKSASWADEPPAYETSATGNQAGESWDLKPTGDQTDNSWNGGDAGAPAATNEWADRAADVAADATTGDDGEGFHQVAGRHRGRGGRGRGSDGEFRGRGRGRGGFRGDGEFRGRGRGGFRGGRGEGGEFRGRGGGRGRGPRGGGEGQARGS